MNKLILIVVVMSMQLMGASDDPKIEIKAKQKNEIVEVKAIIKSPMYGKEEAEKRAQKPEFITHIVAREDGKIVYDATITPTWRKNPFIKFKYKYLGRSDSVELNITDNYGNETSASCKIKDSTFVGKESKNKVPTYIEPSIDFRTILAADVWNEPSITKAIRMIYGVSSTLKNIQLSTNMEGSYHPDEYNIVNISASIKFDSIAIFSNLDSRTALVAIFNTSHNEIIDFSDIVLKTANDPSLIVVIGKGVDGNIYRSQLLPFNVKFWFSNLHLED